MAATWGRRGLLTGFGAGGNKMIAVTGPQLGEGAVGDGPCAGDHNDIFHWCFCEGRQGVQRQECRQVEE